MNSAIVNPMPAIIATPKMSLQAHRTGNSPFEYLYALAQFTRMAQFLLDVCRERFLDFSGADPIEVNRVREIDLNRFEFHCVGDHHLVDDFSDFFFFAPTT
jgi:hypothetical protein